MGVPVDPDENANSAGAVGSTTTLSNAAVPRRATVEGGEVLDPRVMRALGRVRPIAQHRHEVGLGDDSRHVASGDVAAGKVTAELVDREQRVQRHGHRTEQLDREERRDEAAVVAEHDRDTAAGPDPAGPQYARQLTDVAGELVPGAAIRPVDQRQAIADPLDRRREHRRDGRRALAHGARRPAM